MKITNINMRATSIEVVLASFSANISTLTNFIPLVSFYMPPLNMRKLFLGIQKNGQKMDSGLNRVNLIFLRLTQSMHLLPGLSHWKIPLVTVTQHNLSVHQQSTHRTHVTFGITGFAQSSILAQVPKLLRILVIDVIKA